MKGVTQEKWGFGFIEPIPLLFRVRHTVIEI
jgi:hypothetical protein